MPGEIFINSLTVDIEKLHHIKLQVFRSREIREERLVKELSQKKVGPSIVKFIYTLLDVQKHLALK